MQDPLPARTQPGLRRACSFEPIEPLWQRLPSRDPNGQRLADFMMFIPGLKRRSDVEIRQRLQAIHQVLEGYQEVIAFVEMNLRINTLWVSVQARPGLCLEIPLAIQAAVPEALLIGQRPDR
ncbi:hypothetical protein [Thioalkalivibrio sp.]|uniref:hypothetical protein n=1 Tax=Thioalkalivibrio sp. TaxID=2093813 RepID=UPI003974ADA0